MRKKILLALITALTTCTLFGCSSKAESEPIQNEKTQIEEEKENVEPETKNIMEQIQEEIEETGIKDTDYATYYDELQFKIKDSDAVKLPIRISELYDMGFHIIDEETKELMDLDAIHNRGYGYGYIVYTDKDGNESKKLRCITNDLIGNDSKIKDSYVISINTYLYSDDNEEDYEKEITLMDNIKLGVSTKEDVAKKFGYPTQYDENYNEIELTEEEFQEESYFCYKPGDRMALKSFVGEIGLSFTEDGILSNVKIQGECK